MMPRMDQRRKTSNPTLGLGPDSDKVRSYGEIVDYLNALKLYEYSEASRTRMKALNDLCGNPGAKIDIILVGGTNGKSSTIHFASKLLKEEKFNIGCVYSSHFLTINERIAANLNQITNKAFTERANYVINIAEQTNIKATVFELITMVGLMHFVHENSDVAFLEVGYGGRLDATSIFEPKISAVTRVVEDHLGILGKDLDNVAFEMMEIAKPGSWFISAEQSKIRLQKMKMWIEDRGIKWAMPIRKLAQLPYVYEQLYGRVASLGERIAQIYEEDVKSKFSPFLRGNLLATKKGQRGRPTLAAKRHAELNPIKTLKTFWSSEFELLRGRFELLDKERPSILLDNATNLDAFSNLFLGVRLIHYQKTLKGLAIIVGLSKAIDATETIKLMRYLLKKVSGQIFFVPLHEEYPSYNPQDLVAIAKDLNLKTRACASFSEAFSLANDSVDDRNGLIVISGSSKMISDYWKYRDIKKI